MAITMTPAASDHVSKYLKTRGHGFGVRLGVRTSGCSGMAYVLEFVDDIQDEDQVFESDGVTIVIDPKSLLYLDGTELGGVSDLAGIGIVVIRSIRFFNSQQATARWGTGHTHGAILVLTED